MDEQNDRLNFLLQRYVDKALTEAQQEELSELLQNYWNQTNNNDQPELVASQELDWEKMVRDIIKTKEPAPVRRMYFYRNEWFKYAVAIVIILCAGLYLLNNEKSSSRDIKKSTAVIGINDVLPGSNKAILTLSDGTTITLDSVENGTIAEQGNSSIIKKDGQVIYNPQSDQAGAAGSTISYNTMTSPRGGQYKLILPDGTKVWLNAASSITYPTIFAEDRRVVSITGEVYFEVTKNARKPFTVRTYSDEITVLGTSFNVNSYTDEAMVKTSLLEGSVRINKQVLKPGEAYINGKIMSTSLEQDLAWKNGFFSFNKADLPTVMRQLSRWYNVDVKYEGVIPKRAYSGEIERSLTLRQVLEVLSQTRIKYKIEQGNVITILN
jgi:ferric-dicitrate binding protein FerR (iron transport regulator)